MVNLKQDLFHGTKAKKALPDSVKHDLRLDLSQPIEGQLVAKESAKKTVMYTSRCQKVYDNINPSIGLFGSNTTDKYRLLM